MPAAGRQRKLQAASSAGQCPALPFSVEPACTVSTRVVYTAHPKLDALLRQRYAHGPPDLDWHALVRPAQCAGVTDVRRAQGRSAVPHARLRDRKPIRFERVNADTGEEVPWKDIVKAYEYDKGSYVVLEEGDIRSAAPESHEAVEVESFVDASQIDPRYYEKPYLLVPGKKAEKAMCCCARPCAAPARSVSRGWSCAHASTCAR